MLPRKFSLDHVDPLRPASAKPAVMVIGDSLSSARHNTLFAQFLALQMQKIASGLGLTPEQLATGRSDQSQINPIGEVDPKASLNAESPPATDPVRLCSTDVHAAVERLAKRLDDRTEAIRAAKQFVYNTGKRKVMDLDQQELRQVIENINSMG